MSFPYFLDLAFGSEQSCADQVCRVSIGDSKERKCTIVDYSVLSEPNGMILSLEPEMKSGSVVKVSGKLTASTGYSVDALIFDEETFVVYRNFGGFPSVICIPTNLYPPYYWTGWENLKIVIVVEVE